MNSGMDTGDNSKLDDLMRKLAKKDHDSESGSDGDEDDIVAIPRAVSTPRGHAIARARRSTAPVSRAAPRRWRPLAERDAVPDARVTPRPKRAGDGPSDGV